MSAIDATFKHCVTNRRKMSLCNTTVDVDERGNVTGRLHGNEILKVVNGKLYIRTTGYVTATTANRLRPFAKIQIKGGTMYANDRVLDPQHWTEVGEV